MVGVVVAVVDVGGACDAEVEGGACDVVGGACVWGGKKDDWIVELNVDW